MDSPLDRIFHRPVGVLAARVLCATPFSPNAVTLMGAGLALMSGWFLSRGKIPQVGWAVLFYAMAAILDHADGEVARFKKLTSRLGKALDDICDHLGSFAVLAGMFLGIFDRVPGLARWMLWVAATVVFSQIVAEGCALAKERLGTKGEGGEKELEKLQALGGREPIYMAMIAFLLCLAAGTGLVTIYFWILWGGLAIHTLTLMPEVVVSLLDRMHVRTTL